jgi:hypothetical protein
LLVRLDIREPRDQLSCGELAADRTGRLGQQLVQAPASQRGERRSRAIALYGTEFDQAFQGCGDGADQAVPAGEEPEHRLRVLLGDGLAAEPAHLVRRGARVRGELGEEHSSADRRVGLVDVGARRGDRCG